VSFLSHEDVDLALEEQPGWRRQGDTLVRELRFKDFDDAMRFFERVAEAAVDYGRRPDMCIAHSNHVRLEIANPHNAGITVAELRLASKVSAIVEEHHPTAVPH
jgi:4a-hydroxytetrahydrobiopterin dehydratase